MHLIKSGFKRVALAISGGVDSAVSGLLLKSKGYEVTGIFMQNWDRLEEEGYCKSDRHKEDAQWICSKLGIQFKEIDFIKDYWNYVFSELIEDYIEGLTPNPDVLCNKHIKFDKFYEYSVITLGCDAIATGHYANTSFGSYLESYTENESTRLLKAKDELKDQTFFLCDIPQAGLRKTMFPVGNLTKREVKRIACENSLERLTKKKESMGICFVGTRNFKAFMSEYISKTTGKFVDVETGRNVGEHSGIHNYTVGQRCNIPGTPKPYYVVQKHKCTQDIYVASGRYHPALHSGAFETKVPNWICEAPTQLKVAYNGVFECDFRFQHTHPLRRCYVLRADNCLIVNLDKPLDSIAPGQYSVFYKDGECLGGARITRIGPLYYNMNINVNS